MPASPLALYVSAAFLAVATAAYLLFVMSTARLFSRISEQPRLARGVNFLLVPPALLLATLGILLAGLNAVAGAPTGIRTPWALAMFGVGLGCASGLLAAEGMALNRRADARHRAGPGLGTRVAGLALTAPPLLALGALFVRLGIG
jgi:hypothetical protein